MDTVSGPSRSGRSSQPLSDAEKLKQCQKKLNQSRSENQKLRKRCSELRNSWLKTRDQFERRCVVMRAMKDDLDEMTSKAKLDRAVETQMAAQLRNSMDRLHDLEDQVKRIEATLKIIVLRYSTDARAQEKRKPRLPSPEEQNRFFAEMVLQQYNADDQGAELVLEEPLITNPFDDQGKWLVHLNFTARDKDGAVHRLFGESTVGCSGEEPRVLTSCILPPGENGDHSGLRKGCGRCDPAGLVPIYHPPHGFKHGDFVPFTPGNRLYVKDFGVTLRLPTVHP